MIPRRLAARMSGCSATSSTAIRAFSSTQWPQASRAPALSDVPPDQAAAFDAKQKEFRTNLAELNRRKKEQERQSQQSEAAKSSSSSSSPSVTAEYLEKHGMGSLSLSAGEAQRQRDEADNGKKKGMLSSLIHGTEEGREMDREIERSFSQVLARGKYVHSIVFHEVKPDKVDEYVELVGGWYPKVAADEKNKVHLVGSWRTEVGDCDTFVHIWEYQRYSGYHASLHSIQHHPEFAEFDRRLKQLVHSKKTSLMQEFRFWPTSPPRKLGGVFELRSYTLHPGNLLEWETHWQKGLAARREVMEGVGAWFVQIGDLNVVHHLWQFADLEERRARREQSWGIPGWGETVHRTVPLIQNMKSKIMIPMPWSPIG
ncbi:protein NipSnap homolog-like protein 1 [Teratosphaeria destructans]|uniref:Protein NipSnap homolog-like protein 1 n=1 Tax=Teratosphaeria destructans TaxID=418781 RepID=A0A9W7SUB2_9PEZI|nr:protein NipSnap homolog-like protein 1 [Teratosphaeria destructans]